MPKNSHKVVDSTTRYSHFLVTLGMIICAVFSSRFLWIIYVNLKRTDSNILDLWTILGQIFIYEIACAIYFPPLSEAPLGLYRTIPLPLIIITAAVGKGFGAYIACFVSESIRHVSSVLFSLLEFESSPLWSRRMWAYIRRRYDSIAGSINSVIERWGFWGYLFMQSVPFLPMRSSTYIYAAVQRRKILIAGGAAVGTVLRFLIFFFFAFVGYQTYKKVF